VAAGVYTSNEAATCQYVAEHSEARVIFVEDVLQLSKYLPFADTLPKLEALVVWSGVDKLTPELRSQCSKKVITWDELLALEGGPPPAALEERAKAIRPGHCAALIYTSGTTGNPKAVMISHDNIIYESISSLEALFDGLTGPPPPSALRIVSYLPLSHVAGQMLDIIAPLCATASGFDGFGFERWRHYHYCTWFARPDALKGSLKTTLLAARPTFFLGVPRVWEKFREALLEVAKQTTGVKALLSRWAKKQAAAAARQRQLGGTGSFSVGYLFARVILKAVKAAIGLDKAVGCMTAAAPMPREVAEYFASLDIDLLDIYGMSECTGATTASTAATHQFGSVGPPIGPAEVRIDEVAGRDKPGEGEICYRGRHIMMGYMKDEAKTAEAIDKDGWLHSGDVGMLDQDSMLHITGRLKELIITAGGENIAPVPIEDKLKELCPAISNIMMVGDKRKYNVVILTLKTVIDPDTGASTGRLSGEAASVSTTKTDAEAILESTTRGGAWQTYLQRGIDTYNKSFAVSNAQRIQKFGVIAGDFSERGGELTATLKLKRSVAAEIHAEAIGKLYA